MIIKQKRREENPVFFVWMLYVRTMQYGMLLTLDTGSSHAFDKLLLEDEEDYNQRDNG